MELRVMILLGICIGCIATDDVIDGGGGSGDDQESTDTEPGLTDVFIEGSGDEQSDDLSDEKANVRCDPQLNLECWCVYSDGTEVPNSKAYATRLDCSRYRDILPPISSTRRTSTTSKPTTTKASLPSRSKPVQPHNVIETSEEDPVDDITYEEVEEEEEANKNNDPAVEENSIHYNVDIPLKSENEDEKPAAMDNNVPKYGDVVKPEGIDEAEEELTNQISGSKFKAQASRDSSIEKEEMTPHPGILAALIGGGVVLLLCAVLIILFIIYRVRKKDEGSYPLGDEKPLKNYAYSKAPSREFFA